MAFSDRIGFASKVVEHWQNGFAPSLETARQEN
jgi:hypothetical protein